MKQQIIDLNQPFKHVIVVNKELFWKEENCSLYLSPWRCYVSAKGNDIKQLMNNSIITVVSDEAGEEIYEFDEFVALRWDVSNLMNEMLYLTFTKACV